MPTYRDGKTIDGKQTLDKLHVRLRKSSNSVKLFIEFLFIHRGACNHGWQVLKKGGTTGVKLQDSIEGKEKGKKLLSLHCSNRVRDNVLLTGVQGKRDPVVTVMCPTQSGRQRSSMFEFNVSQ